jgi:hypothetical protein
MEQALQEVLEARIDRLCNQLAFDYTKRYPSSLYPKSYEVEAGRKYYKIWMVDNGRCVHAFVDKATGNVYKPANYRAPAKGVRYNLLDDAAYKRCLKAADWSGSYLYIR